MTIRPLTRQEAIPPTLAAPADVAALARAYMTAQGEQAQVEQSRGVGSEEAHRARIATAGARKALEDRLLELSLSHGLTWYRVDDALWGLVKRGWRGFELSRRPAKGQTP